MADLTRCHAKLSSEAAREVRLRSEAHIKGDVTHTLTCFEQTHGLIESEASNILTRRIVRQRFELSLQLSFAQFGMTPSRTTTRATESISEATGLCWRRWRLSAEP